MKADGLTRLLLNTVGDMKLEDLPMGKWTVAELVNFISGSPEPTYTRTAPVREPKLPKTGPRKANSGPRKAGTRKAQPPAAPPEAEAKRKNSRKLSGKYMGLIRGVEGVRARDKIKRIAKVDGLEAAINFMEQMRNRRA